MARNGGTKSGKHEVRGFTLLPPAAEPQKLRTSSWFYQERKKQVEAPLIVKKAVSGKGAGTAFLFTVTKWESVLSLLGHRGGGSVMGNR